MRTKIHNSVVFYPIMHFKSDQKYFLITLLPRIIKVMLNKKIKKKKPDLSPVFFCHKNVTNFRTLNFRKKSKFISNENLFLNNVIGKFRLAMNHSLWYILKRHSTWAWHVALVWHVARLTRGSEEAFPLFYIFMVVFC